MAKTPKQIPEGYSQPLGMRILKADAYRQASMLRQEVAAELVGILGEREEHSLRRRLVRFIEQNVDAGTQAATKARETWPDHDEAMEIIDGTELKDSQKKKQREIFERFEGLNDKSHSLLENSFRHIRIILERLHPAK
jgi:hypothetical protein